jgi:hypothetical protein
LDEILTIWNHFLALEVCLIPSDFLMPFHGF